MKLNKLTYKPAIKLFEYLLALIEEYDKKHYPISEPTDEEIKEFREEQENG